MAQYAPRDRMASEKDAIVELVRRWNEGNLDITDDRANKLAQKAYEHGIDFDPQSRPISKGLFDLVDTAAFGMVPNSWRPESVGEKYFGESGLDKFAGGVGTVGGLLPAGGLLLKGASKIAPMAGQLGNKVASGGAGEFASAGAEYAGSLNVGNRLKTAVASAKESQAFNRSKEIARKYYGDRNNPYNIDFTNLGL